MQNPPKMVHKQHHAQQQQQQQQRRSSPALTRQEIEAAVQDRVKRTAPYIKPGAVVVYEFLDEAQEWHWSLGTVQRANPHVVTLAEWSCEFDGLDKSVMATLGKEEARIRREMEDHQATILALRSELGAVRTHNESEMNAARDAIEERRRGMEATTDALDRCAQRGVALRLNCGIDEDDVLAAVLRAALSIVEDYVPVEPLPWDVIWATVCDPVFLQRCVNYDAGYDMSVEQRDDIVACYVDSQLITEAKVRRAAAQMAMKSPDLNEVLCATASWVFTQLSAFRVYQKCASTQSYADELQQQLTHHVNSLKEGIRKLRQVQAQLRVPSGVPGDPSGTSSTPGADTHYTFVPLEDSTIEVLRCAVICPLPTSSPVQKAASSPALEESTPPSVKGDGSSRSSSAPPLKGSRNGNRTGTAHAHAAPSPSPEVIVLDQEELDEIVSRATQDRPQLLKALDDLQRECGRLERELAFVKSFTKEAAIPPAASLRSATAPSSRASLVERPPSQMAPDAGHNGRPYRIRPSANDDDSDGSDEEADTRALQNVLLGLHRDLQGARRENEQLKRSLEREAHKHKAEAAELGRQLHAVRAEHEDALGRLADAKIHCEALQAENDDLEKSVADLTDRIHAHEKELQNDPGDIRSASKSTKRTDPDEVNATPAPSEVDAVADPDAMLAEGKVPSPGHDAATAQPACVTHHRKHLDGDGWPDAVRHHPDRMQAAVAVDAANACRVLNDAITHVQFSPYGCTAEFDVSHAPEIAQRTLDEKIEQRPFDECARVLCDDEEHRSAKDLLHHLEERDATIRDLEQHLEELKAQLAQLSAADNPVEATKAAEPPSSLPDATALQEELDHARQANAFLQASVDELADKLQAARDENADLVDSNNAVVAELRQQVADTQDQLSDAARCQQSSDAEIADLKQQLEEGGATDPEPPRHVGCDSSFAKEGEDSSHVPLGPQQHPANTTAAALDDPPVGAASVAALQQKLEEEAATNASLQKAMQDAVKDNAELRNIAAAAQIGREAIEAECADLQKKLHDCEAPHSPSARDLGQPAAASISIAEMNKGDTEEVLQQLAAAQQRNAKKDAEIADLRDQLADAEQRAKDAEDAKAAEGSDKDAEIADLRDQLADAEQRAKDAEDAKAAEGSDKDAEIADLRDQLADAEQRAKDAEDAKAAEGSDKDAEIADLRDQLANAAVRGNVADAYEDRIGALTVELEAMSAECTDTLEKLEECMALLEESRQGEAELRERLMSKEDEVFKLKCQLDFAQKELVESEARMAAQGPAVDPQVLSALEDEVAVLRVDKDELEDAFARRNEEHQLEVDALNDKVDELTAELEDKGEDYANTLEKLEEFVGLLETARASERAALQSLDDTEHELGVQQAQHDDEMAATHRIIDGLRRERNDLQRQLSERVGGASLEPLRGERTEVRSPQSATLGGDEDEGTATSGTLRSAMQATRGSSSTMREQLEQLKREKEALLSELAMRDAD
ncbi:putative mitochondrial hypothetical protein, unknown function [Leptomonas pyrrhocoris]|uniref:Flagellar attachment zone protein 1 conserved domain-containing protein n=1 Tax=Leptomonas pyrrhocoris TaxID=157538 RepID=A0A0N0VHP7_LEPPY|nr:putative mitochondrial hypothetical protein, unknown function [Leptomonas pyrrhocoris]XP_015664218.1 putative mitochondrial hypothetical protein, unknown function [Leptomonas pyrrhocoris]KPA85778.1 putative mitochondrial hypothetical protein, unknown function [Leptomonas pyrrhocoris]KPA85779.1 putative mitochondrial hypothetical protein, unknown function [Leptomonas pyrrhocoris]|eukprot:XP_015664217.1 putative mitochondrial hypothetical protein, unknown function [Leptomonas pyrrhocoris]